MRDRIGVAEALLEGRAAGNVGDILDGHGVHHQEPLDHQRVLLCRRSDAERIEHRKRVGGDMEADANFAELARLLQHEGAESPPRQRQRAGEAADAAAGDGNWSCVPRLVHPLTSPRLTPGSIFCGEKFF